MFVGSPELLLQKRGRDEITAYDINELLDHTTSRISTKGKYLALGLNERNKTSNYSQDRLIYR